MLISLDHLPSMRVMPSIPLLLVSTLCQPCSVISCRPSSWPYRLNLDSWDIWGLVLIISIGLAHWLIVLILTWFLRGSWWKIRWFLKINTDFIDVLVIRSTLYRVSFPTNFKIMCYWHGLHIISSISSLKVILLLLLVGSCCGAKRSFSKLSLAQFFRLVLSNLFFIVSVEQLVTVDRTMLILNRFFQFLCFYFVCHYWIWYFNIWTPLLIYNWESGIIMTDRRSLV